MSERSERAGDPRDALQAARADAARRIAELRESAELAPAPALPDLRSVLSRAEGHVSELRDTAADLKAVLPTRVEAAISRALAGSEGTSLGRQVEDLRRLALETSAAMDSLAADVHEDQVGRVEDLETMVDLIAASTAAVRSDVARVEDELAETRRAIAGMARGLADLAGSIADLSAKLDRPVSMTLTPDPGPVSEAPPTGPRGTHPTWPGPAPSTIASPDGAATTRRPGGPSPRSSGRGQDPSG